MHQQAAGHIDARRDRRDSFRHARSALSETRMQVLWAPWRMAYIGAPKQPGCIFCDLPVGADQKVALVLARTPHSVIMLNRFPYANGHIMVAPRRHTGDLGALPAVEHVELSETLRRSLVLVQEF